MQHGKVMLSETLVEYPSSLVDHDGKVYIARARGRRRDDGLWEAWIEFEREDGGIAVRTERETTQPNHADLLYWASGLTPVYLEGAFRRASEPPVHPSAATAAIPTATGRALEPVLDPFEVYASGEAALRARLDALASWHLRNVALAHGLGSDRLALEGMSKRDLIELIVDAVRAATDQADAGLRR